MSTGYTNPGTSTGLPWPGLQRSASDSSWELITDEEAEPPAQQPVVPVVKQELWQPGQVPFLVVHPAEKRAKQRVHRAARAGLSARDKLEGVVRATVSSLKLPQVGSTTWYACLHCKAAPSGFLTRSYPIYASKVIGRNGKFELGSVSHSFTCLVEVAAYLAGASAQWPVELQH